MVKGAVLIGCNFMPTEMEIGDAVQHGYIKNCHTVSTLGCNAPVQVEAALTIYVQIAREQGWDEPTGLQARQFTTREGQRVWSVWPVA